MKRERHYFVHGHTQAGFFSVLPQLMKQLEAMFVLKGLSRRLADAFLHEMGNLYLEEGHAVDFIWHPSDAQKLEGIRLREKNIAVFHHELVEKVKENLCEPRIVSLSFAKALDNEKKALHEEKIKLLEKERDDYYKKAYECFQEAKIFHEEKEKLYFPAIDFQKADAVSNKLIKKIFPDEKQSKNASPNEETLFFGAATPNGAVNFIESLTEGTKKRYIVKGRSGSGKSTLIRKIGAEAQKRGYNITYFLCGFDPKSVDMLIIEDLLISIFDGTSPHVIDPTRETDEVIDLFRLTMNQRVEEEKKAEIALLEQNYKQKMQQGTYYLQKAKQAHDVMDEYVETCFYKEKLQALLEAAKNQLLQAI